MKTNFYKLHSIYNYKPKRLKIKNNSTLAYFLNVLSSLSFMFNSPSSSRHEELITNHLFIEDSHTS